MAKFNLDLHAPKLEAQGMRLVDTNIRGVTLGLKGESIVIFAGKNGMLSMDKDMIMPLFNEIWDIIDHLEDV